MRPRSIAALCLTALSISLPVEGSSHRAGSCGSEEWPIKVASDPEANKIIAMPFSTTIAKLRALQRPAHPQGRTSAELQVWQVTGFLVEYRAESDGDIHLVIADEAGATLVAEIPREDCTAGSRFTSPIAFARRQFQQLFSPSSRKHSGRQTPITLIGVGYFDHEHGVSGASPNGFELHPVLAMAWR